MSWVSEVKWDIPCAQPEPDNEDNPSDVLMRALMALDKGDASVMGSGAEDGYTIGEILHDGNLHQALDIAMLIIDTGEDGEFSADRVVEIRLHDLTSPVADL